MSLFGDYILEREGKQIIEDEKGFITYIIEGDGSCFISDMYIIPEERHRGYGKILMDKVGIIAKKYDCICLTTTVCPTTEGSTHALKSALNYGFRLVNNIDDLIIIQKSLEK